jgi:hypothetical protein
MLLITPFVRRTLLVTTLAVLMGEIVQAQAYIYADADVYLKNRTADPYLPIGEAVGEFVDLYPNMGQWTLLFEKDGVKRKVKCKDIWGFMYKGVLFRINEEGPIPVRVMTEGAVCYYENGFAHLYMQRNDTELGEFEVGHGSYLSKDLRGPMVPAIFKDDDTRSVSGRFRTEYPQLEPLFKCIGDRDQMDTTRQCVVDFEAGVLGNN